MDPIPDIPPAITQPADQSPTMTTNNTHPPYAEMIIAAITALKDKDGSSRQAISKYIEQKFTNLPPTHSTLLTHHLKRLKNLGQIVLVKHSYMLPPPTSGEFISSGYHPTIDYSDSCDVTDANVDAIVDAIVDAVGVSLEDHHPPSKRKPGRPPKVKTVPPNVQANDADVASYQYHGGVDVSYGSGSDLQGNSGGGSGPLFAALGLGDDGVAVEPSPVAENTPLVVKRGRGRPPKSAGGKAVASGGGGEVQGGEAGRNVEGGNSVRVKRGRGRPRRFGIGAVTVPLSGNLLRPRGKGKRVGRPNVVVDGGAGVGVSGLKRRGRPSRNKIANLIGESLSRRSKVGLGTVVVVTDPQQLVVYQELKSKYEHLQSKVKQVASVVKSCIDPEYGNTALAALQELEDLAGQVGAPHGSNP